VEVPGKGWDLSSGLMNASQGLKKKNLDGIWVSKLGDSISSKKLVDRVTNGFGWLNCGSCLKNPESNPKRIREEMVRSQYEEGVWITSVRLGLSGQEETRLRF
jgi:hypothetical protein